MMNKVWKLWSSFWFAPQSLLNIAFMRVVLTGAMLHLYFLRSWNTVYFTDAWLVPRKLAILSMDELYRPLWAWFFWPDAWVPVVHALFVLSLLLLFLGIGGRLLALFAWVLHMGFLYRNYGISYGADVIAGVFLFYLAWSDNCARLSVMNLWKKKKSLRTESDWLTSAMMRMIQFQICIIYAYTGFEKLRGQAWWDGTALWSVLANPQMVFYDLTFIRHLPILIAIGSFSSILLEIYFPAAMLHPKARRPWLIMGFFFHLGIGLLMGLMHFSLVMISTYFLFIDPRYLEQVLSRFKLGFSKMRPSAAGNLRR